MNSYIGVVVTGKISYKLHWGRGSGFSTGILKEELCSEFILVPVLVTVNKMLNTNKIQEGVRYTVLYQLRVF